MALVARPISDALQQNMAGLKPHHANGKRKAPAPLPSGTRIVDLTIEDDDQPTAKRHKSHPVEDSTKNGLQSHPHNDPHLSSQQIQQPRVNGNTLAQRPRTESSVPATRLPPSTQQPKQAHTKVGASQPVRPFNPIQYTGEPSSSKGISRPAGTPDNSGSSNWESRVTADGKVFYVNHKTKTSSWILPSSGSTADPSFQKSDRHRKGFARTTDSESEDVLQEFRLPQTSAIKFEADASPVPIGSSKKPIHTTHKSDHQKQPSYDQTDRDKVKPIFSSSSRPTSSSNAEQNAPQPHNEAGRQRQSQRETKVPERLVTQPQPVKATSLPSRTTTPRIDAQRREQTPLRSQISVVIPVSQHKYKQPVVNLEDDQVRKQSLLWGMKKGVAIVSERGESVERYFGTTGFAAIYGTASDEERLKIIHKLQPKVKKVKRRDVKLDWGDDIPAETKPFKHNKLVHPREQVKEITKSTVLSITSGPPITFVNDLDDRRLNGKFQFISEYVIREGVKRQLAHSHVHVNCSSTCTGVCSPTTCACMRNDKMQMVNNAPVPTYHQRPNGLVVLTDTFIKLSKTESAKTEIVECNKNCHCDEGCLNRVVQKGRTVPLEIYKTQFCGFGLRCPQDIVQGQFIDVYLGELVTEAMLSKRESAQTDGEPSYLFTLDWFNEKVNHVHYHIDGEHFGSSMRFINHSCNANCSVFPVMLEEYDENIYGLAVFALKDIPAMTDLTLDYAPQLEGADPADFAKCQCGEKNCRGYLWPKPRTTRKARRRKAI